MSSPVLHSEKRRLARRSHRWSFLKEGRHRIDTLNRKLIASAAVIGLAFMLLHGHGNIGSRFYPTGELPPLAMQAGDPYIRALMRTISASESNVSNPYAVIYGGEYVENLSRHPDRCERIVNGPNVGNCTTAAGRYQFLTTTWQEMAVRYHPHPSQFLFWQSYSFEPEYQDAVVYAWLSDYDAWDADIPWLLRQGKLNEVLRLLSGTWTSLGYGIEDNSMTGYLPTIYEEMLQQELRSAN